MNNVEETGVEKIVEKLQGDLEPYKPLPFWSWNDKLRAEELKRQIYWMHEMGMGGFFMHARNGLKTEYLSEEWMQCIEICCEEANNLGMKAWGYDENGYPSGFVGGKLLENPENRDMHIQYKIGIYDKTATVSYLLTEKQLIRVSNTENLFADVNHTYLNLYLNLNTDTVDILNPAIVEQFLNETHCKYKESFGESFSSKIAGFFTDEPEYYRWKTPYTPMIREYFQDKYAEDVFDGLGLLFVEKEGYRTFRYRYWTALQELMLKNYAAQIFQWCEMNGVQLTGHYIEETSMAAQLWCCGGVYALL